MNILDTLLDGSLEPGLRDHVHCLTVDGIQYLNGQFWTAKQRQGHPIHEISYRACFKAELPEFFISRLTHSGDRVYDPFSGRGTTAVQAGIMGRGSLANDINPLSAMLCRPRLAAPDLLDIRTRLDGLRDTIDAEPVPSSTGNEDLLPFFHPITLMRLRNLQGYLADRQANGLFDHVDDWIRMVAINRLTGHSSGYFSGYTLPPNQAVSPASQRKINTDRGLVPPQRDVVQIIQRKSASLLREGAFQPPLEPVLSTGPAWKADIPDASAALVVTSPPFLDVVQYDKDNWLRCWFAGIDPGSVAISHIRDVPAWQEMVRDVLGDLARIVHPGGHVAFEVGEVRGGKVLLERLVWNAAAGLPFERLLVMVNEGAFSKTANIWKVANNRQGTNTNRIVLLRRT